MAQYNHLPIFQETYRLALDVHRAIHEFPKEHKYGLGTRLKDDVSDLLDLVVAANSADEKAELLRSARLKLEQFRIQLRLSSDLRILGLKRYEHINRLVEGISKQLSGWFEWAKARGCRPDPVH